jgi:hypothetical protein
MWIDISTAPRFDQKTTFLGGRIACRGGAFRVNVVLVVEGHGDVEAFPTLVARAAHAFGVQAFSTRPIRAGGFPRLVRQGEFERFVRLAAGRPDAARVVVALDLDDGCAMEESAGMNERRLALEGELGIPIDLCFCVREYESWFLEELENLRADCPNYDWLVEVECENPTSIRAAKGFLGRAMKANYKETVDQLRLTRALNIPSLYEKSRSFRKFVKCITGLDYETMNFNHLAD